MEIKLTKADKIILKNIAHNPRIFEKKLAQKCNLSKDSIRYRINRLEKSLKDTDGLVRREQNKFIKKYLATSDIGSILLSLLGE